jgi:hypothetical protein
MTKPKVTYLYCWASGLAQFGDSVPDGAIVIDSRTARQLRAEKATLPKPRKGETVRPPLTWQEKMTTLMRIGYKGELLVPGVPEAANQSEGVKALIKFKKWAVQP